MEITTEPQTRRSSPALVQPEGAQDTLSSYYPLADTLCTEGTHHV